MDEITITVKASDLVAVLALANLASDKATNEDAHAYTRVYMALKTTAGKDDGELYRMIRRLYPVLMKG